MFTYLVAIPLIFHGLANLAGFFAPWTAGLLGFANVAWSFSGGVIFKSSAGQLFSLVWLASSGLLVAAGLGILLHKPWWPELILAGCVFSLAAILPWWQAVPPGARFGAIFDVLALILILSPLSVRIVQAVR